MKQPGDRMPAPPELALAQDLANTIDIERGVDSLRTPDDLAAFAGAHGLLDQTFGPTDLAQCLAFREALRDACHAHAGADLPETSAHVLANALRRAPVILTIDRAGEASVTAADGLRGTDALVAHLAAGIATAVANDTWPRLKACTACGCRWVYYDHSPAGRGRWCTMKICGSRAKVRNWRQRQAGQ
jgi:predicted RNA-binding Zn ribbon-like protein